MCVCTYIYIYMYKEHIVLKAAHDASRAAKQCERRELRVLKKIQELFHRTFILDLTRVPR